MKTLLAVLFLPFVLAPMRAEELPAAWPEGWREAYARFDKFVADRKRLWPKSGLTISPEGAVQMDVNFDETREQNRTLALFQDGVGNLGSGLQKGGSGGSLPIFGALLPKRLNAAVLLTTGVFGFQYVPPIVWFEVEPQPGSERTLFGGSDRRIHVLPAPEPAEDFLPNERFLAWRDFQVLPTRSRDDIREGNRKVSPAVFLQVDHAGVVHRKLPEDARAEAALGWRVYVNGRLVHRGPVGGQARLDTGEYGAGNYTVLAGIDGPSGFLPVSNLLQFTLAPGSAEKLELLFSRFDCGRAGNYPAWYFGILPPPLGGGPATFATDEELAVARTLASAWKGCADMANAPGAPWILPPEGGVEP